MKNKSTINSYGKIIIIICFLISVLAIGFIIVFELTTYNNVTDEKTVDKLVDLQSITLAITGIAISLISVIGTVFSVEREQKYEKIKRSMEEISLQYDESLQDMKKQQDLLRKNSENLENLLLINGMFLDKRKEKLLETACQTSDSMYIKYIYIRTLHNNLKSHDSEEQKSKWCESIIKYGKDLLEANKSISKYDEFEKTQIYNVIIMIADAYYYSANISIENCKMNNDEKIREYFDWSLYYYNKAEDLFVDKDGYVANSIGLINYCKYKHFVCLRKEKNINYLDESIEYYQRAIKQCNFNPVYYNNLGVSYLLKAKGTEKEKYWEMADNNFKQALRIDNTATKAAINIADIEIRKIRKTLNLENEPIILTKCSVEITKEMRDKLDKSYERSKKYFNYASMYNLYFPNVYYKKAQLLVYYLYYNESKMRPENIIETKERILDLLAYAKKINPTATGILYIERLFYDYIGDFEASQKINEEIRGFNKTNAEKWDGLYETLVKEGALK